MFRWLAVCLVLAGGTFALVAILSPKIQGQQKTPSGSIPAKGEEPKTVQVEGQPVVTEPSGSDAKPLIPGELYELKAGARHALEVVITGGTMILQEQQEVPAEREGKVLFIGTEVQGRREDVPPEDLITVYRNGTVSDPLFFMLAVEAKEGDEKTFSLPGTTVKYREWRDTDVPEPGKTVVVSWPKAIRKLKVGMPVKKGQLLALINPSVAYTDLNVEKSALDAAAAEWESAKKAKASAHELLSISLDALRRAPGSIPMSEIVKQRQEANKAMFEELAKENAIKSAQAKLTKAAATLRMHEVRSSINGTIRHIYKNSQGDAVKPNEGILQIQNPELLRIETLLDIQEALKLQKGMEAIVEATRPEPPKTVLGGHLESVSCVAVSKGEQPLVFSGGEDKVLLGFDLASGEKRWRQALWSVPRAMACTGPRAKANLLLVGDATGMARIFNVDDLKAEARELKEKHQGTINCVAFSPDGTLCATGGEDRALRIWSTETGERLHLVAAAHRGPLTAVQFADKGRLFTAGRDRKLIVWDVSEGKAPVAVTEFSGRSNDVGQIGGSDDGQRVLIEQGRELRVLSVDRKQIEGTLVNPPGAPNFGILAQFSPDGKAILTNGAAAGHLQLWRAPTPEARASELRQFVWNGAITCAAFAPDAPYAVTGTQDHQVLVWQMPDKKELSEQIKATLSLVEHVLDTRSRQVRVWAELKNPGWLVPGGPATLVVPLVAPPPERLPMK